MGREPKDSVLVGDRIEIGFERFDLIKVTLFDVNVN